jgi:prolyl oligopeptidase
MRKSLILMTLPIAACSTTPPAGPIPAPPQVEAALAPEVTPAAANALAYPQTRREDVVENQFGVAVADPYRWLENDVRKDPAVAAWVTEQNKVTDAFLDTLPGRDLLKKRMTELYNYERVGTPVKKGRRYFYQRNTGLQNQSPLFVRDSLNGPERLLIDPNTFSQDGATALGRMGAERGRPLSPLRASRTAGPTGVSSRCSTSPPARPSATKSSG